MKARIFTRNKKCVLIFIPLPMNSRNDPWYSKRLSIIWAGWCSCFLFRLRDTDRETVGTCPVKEVIGIDMQTMR